MGNSLQDELLKSGLVSSNQLREARKKPKQKKRAKSKAPPPARNPRTLNEAQDKKRAQDRAKNLEDEQARERKRVRQQIHKMILDNQQNVAGAETVYNFVKGSRVKRFYVSEAQRDELAAGKLSITAAKGRHYIIAAELGAKIRALEPEYFVHVGGDEATSPDTTDKDESDPYAGYEVPDDLMW